MREDCLGPFHRFRKTLSGGWREAFLLILFLIMIPLLNAQAPQSGFYPERSVQAPLNSPGPAVGEKIPFFRAPDQYGRMQDFASLRGPQGAMVVFERSLDW